MFAEAPSGPIQRQPQAYTTRKAVDQIRELHQQGASVREISEATGISRMTLHRLLNQFNGSELKQVIYTHRQEVNFLQIRSFSQIEKRDLTC